MNLIDIIPIGKIHKKTRQEIIKEANITDIRTFRKEMAKLREKYIIISLDDGYYAPASKEEYLEFINKQKEKLKDIDKTIKLAKKEMEELK